MLGGPRHTEISAYKIFWIYSKARQTRTKVAGKCDEKKKRHEEYALVCSMHVHVAMTHSLCKMRNQWCSFSLFHSELWTSTWPHTCRQNKRVPDCISNNNTTHRDIAGPYTISPHSIKVQVYILFLHRFVLDVYCSFYVCIVRDSYKLSIDISYFH